MRCAALPPAAACQLRRSDFNRNPERLQTENPPLDRTVDMI
jgi:hypothetical protein